MSVMLVLFLAVVAIAVLAAVCAIVVYLERNFPGEKYDERQKVARGNAYRLCFWVGMVYYLILIPYLVMGVYDEWVVEPYLLVTIGFILQMLSFHIYCLMTHSALPLGEKPIPTVVSYFLLGGMYLAQYLLLNTGGNTVDFSGYESVNGLRLLMALGFCFLAVVHLIAYLRKEKE